LAGWTSLWTGFPLLAAASALASVFGLGSVDSWLVMINGQ
jgi:hypothetical protein